jgi:hypothetical protein
MAASSPSGIHWSTTAKALPQDSRVAGGHAATARSPAKANASIPVLPDDAGLPDDWLNAELTPAQYRLLSPAQKRQKREADVDQFFPQIPTKNRVYKNCVAGWFSRAAPARPSASLRVGAHPTPLA